MIWTVSEMQLIEAEEVRKHAGGKAREDLSTLFKRFGISEIILEAPQLERKYASPAKKLLYHYEIAGKWKEIADQINSGDTLIIQFPLINHTLLLAPVLRKMSEKGIRLVAFIHDLELIRHSRNEDMPIAKKWRLKREELDELNLFDALIVHNEHMKDFLHSKLGIKKEKMYNLELFDYLTDEDFQPNDETVLSKKCIIAGNLLRFKSAYIYKLPNEPDFELYGINYEDKNQENLHYHGSFMPEELPKHLSGSFGLVWDGDSIETCSGAWGEYLRYNNPHKTSLYLASGIPVITWNEAAMADFLLKEDAGITIGSLNEMADAMKTITPERYLTMKKNAEKISVRVRNGYYTRMALEAAKVIPVGNHE